MVFQTKPYKYQRKVPTFHHKVIPLFLGLGFNISPSGKAQFLHFTCTWRLHPSHLKTHIALHYKSKPGEQDISNIWPFAEIKYSIYRCYVRVSVFHLNFNNVVEESKLHPCVIICFKSGIKTWYTWNCVSTPWNIFDLVKSAKEALSKGNSIFQPSICRCDKYLSFRMFQGEYSSFCHDVFHFKSQSSIHLFGCEVLDPEWRDFWKVSRDLSTQVASFIYGDSQVLRGRIYLDLRFIYVWVYWWNYIHTYVCNQIWG